MIFFLTRARPCHHPLDMNINSLAKNIKPPEGGFMDIPAETPLALGVLRSLARLVQTVLLAFDGTCVARDITGLTQRGTK